MCSGACRTSRGLYADRFLCGNPGARFYALSHGSSGTTDSHKRRLGTTGSTTSKRVASANVYVEIIDTTLTLPTATMQRECPEKLGTEVLGDGESNGRGEREVNNVDLIDLKHRNGREPHELAEDWTTATQACGDEDRDNDAANDACDCTFMDPEPEDPLNRTCYTGAGAPSWRRCHRASGRTKPHRRRRRDNRGGLRSQRC